MDDISTKKVQTLGEKFDITATSDEMEWVLDYVDSGLDGIDRLPIGLQLIGPAFREDTLLGAERVESILN